MPLTQAEIIELQRKMLRGEEPEPIKQEDPTLSAKEIQQKIAQEKAQIISQAKAEGLIPKEAEAIRVIPTKEGYQIEYVVPPPKQPTWKETTVAGQIYEQKRPRIERYHPIHIGEEITFTPTVMPFMVPITKATSEFGAGLYAIGESWLRPEIPTPIGEGIRRITGQPTKYETGEVSPFFLAGGAVGTVFETALISVGVGYVLAGAKRIAPEFLKQPLAKGVAKITQATKVSRIAKVAHKTKLAFQRTIPSFRGSRAEMFLIKRVPWFTKYATKGISRGEIALSPLKQPLTFKQLQASQIAWQLTHVPRTGGVILIQKGLAPTKMKVFPHLISRTGKVSIGYLREVAFEDPIWKRGLLPFVTQKQVTRMGIIPYIPRAVTVTGKKGISQLTVGVAVTTLAKTIQTPRRKRREPLILMPKIWQPTLTREREKFRALTILKPKVKQRERLIPALKVPQILAQVQLPKQAQIQKQIQKQAQKQLQLQRMIVPTPQITKLIGFPPIRLPKARRKKRRRRRYGEEWFFKLHPLATPKQVFKSFMGSSKRKR